MHAHSGFGCPGWLERGRAHKRGELGRMPIQSVRSRRGCLSIAVAIALCVLLAGCATRGYASAGTVPAPPEPPPSADQVTPGPPASDIFASGIQTGYESDAQLWLAWSLVDRSDGRRVGSANSSTERTNAESSIKAWIAADFLRVAGNSGRDISDYELGLIDQAIRASDDAAAEQLYRTLGADSTLRDLNSQCGIVIETSRSGYWSYAQITAEDATRILDCVLTKAPGYPHGDKLLAALYNVEPEGAFGVRSVLPANTPVATKNGWTLHSSAGVWNVNCVASWDHYTLAVLTRYPAEQTLEYGVTVCREVTQAILGALS